MSNNRPRTQRSSSQANVKAFSDSFSCVDFGGFDPLELESLAVEAEHEAEQRINKAQAERSNFIDNMLEAETEIETTDSSQVDSFRSRRPPRRSSFADDPTMQLSASLSTSLSQLKNSRVTRGLDPGGLAAPLPEEEEYRGNGSLSSIVFNEQSPETEAKPHYHSVRPKTNSTAYDGNSILKSKLYGDEESNLTLQSSGHGGAAAIQINAPNVTINYIIEQKGNTDQNTKGDIDVAAEVDLIEEGRKLDLRRDNDENSKGDINVVAEVDLEEEERKLDLRRGNDENTNRDLSVAAEVDLIEEEGKLDPRGLHPPCSNTSDAMNSPSTSQSSASATVDLIPLLNSLWTPSKSKSNLDDSNRSDSSSGVYTAGMTDFSSSKKKLNKSDPVVVKRNSHNKEKATNDGDGARVERDKTGNSEKPYIAKKRDRASSSHRKMKTDQPRMDAQSSKKKAALKMPNVSATKVSSEPAAEARSGSNVSDSPHADQRSSSMPFGQGRPQKGTSMRNLLATLKSESKGDLSIYEDMSTSSANAGYLPSSHTKAANDTMGAIQEGEVSDSSANTSVASSSAPSYNISDDISAFARTFVKEFSMREEDRKRRASLVQDESEQPAPGEHRARPAMERSQSAAANASSSSNKLNRSRSLGADKTVAARSGHRRRSSSRKARRRSSNEAHIMHNLHRGDYVSGSFHGDPRYNGTSYCVGDFLLSEDDVVREDVESALRNISRLEVMDTAFVRRSGKRWSFAIVTDVSRSSIKFVVDKAGASKKIERSGWVHNILRVSPSLSTSKSR